jgi:hypothetical protein
MTCLALSYFSTLSHKWYDFRENIIEYKMCLLFVSTIFACNFSHNGKNSERYCHKYTDIFKKSARYSCEILVKLEFSEFFLITQILNSMKIRPVGA